MEKHDRVVNVAVVGCGPYCQGSHLPNAHMNPMLNIRALCDINEEILAKVTEQYQPDYATRDFSRICEDPEIEMVIIGTGPNARLCLIKPAAEAGKHIFVEKPMSIGYDDSKAIVDVVRANGIKLQVGFNRPYAPIMREAKRIFKKVKKGETLITYRIVGESIVWPQFYRDALADDESSIIHELVHIFDLMNWLVEDRPSTVYAIGGHSDNDIVTLTYPNDTAVVLTIGGCGTEAYPKERMEIFTDNKVIVMNDFVELECTRIPGEKDQRFPVKTNPIGSLDLSAAELREQLTQFRDVLTPEQLKHGYYYHLKPLVYKGQYHALEFLRKCIVEDEPTEINENAGALATILGLKALESLRETKAPVTLDYSFLTQELQTCVSA